MPRPKLHSDETILSAARDVLVREGPVDFTLADVAAAVGISRAALIQRFQDKATLHRKVMEAMTQEVRDYFAAKTLVPGVDGLWGLLRELIGGMDSETGNEAYLLLFWGDIVDPQLRGLALERNELVRHAIENCLPDTPVDRHALSGLIQSVIQGSYMQWMVSREGKLADYMAVRSLQLLRVLYPDHRL